MCRKHAGWNTEQKQTNSKKNKTKKPSWNISTDIMGFLWSLEQIDIVTWLQAHPVVIHVDSNFNGEFRSSRGSGPQRAPSQNVTQMIPAQVPTGPVWCYILMGSVARNIMTHRRFISWSNEEDPTHLVSASVLKQTKTVMLNLIKKHNSNPDTLGIKALPLQRQQSL